MRPSSTAPSVHALFRLSRDVARGCSSPARAEMQVPFGYVGLVAEHM